MSSPLNFSILCRCLFLSLLFSIHTHTLAGAAFASALSGESSRNAASHQYISPTSDDTETGPYTVWSGSKTCSWGDGVTIPASAFQSVKVGDVLKFWVSDIDCQIVLGGWEGLKLSLADVANFPNLSYQDGVITLVMIDDYETENTFNSSEADITLNVFEKLKESGLILHGSVTLTRVDYIPASGVAIDPAILQAYQADMAKLLPLQAAVNTMEEKLHNYPEIEAEYGDDLNLLKTNVDNLITKANNAFEEAQTSGSYNGPTQIEIKLAQVAVFTAIETLFNKFIEKYNSFSEKIDNEWPGYKVIESERIAAIEATIAEIQSMLKDAKDSYDITQVNFDNVDVLESQYNGLTTDFKSQRDEFWAAHADDVAKLDALKTKMADFNTLVEESFPGYAEQKAAEIAAVTEAISALQANIEEAYANAMSSGVYTHPADDEFSAIDAAIDALAAGLNGSLDDIQQQYQADIQQLMILKTILETIEAKLSDEKYDDIRQLVTPGLDERKNEVEDLITKANNALNAAQTSGSYDGPTQDEITTAQDNVFGFVNGIFNLFITKYDSFSEKIDNEWPGYKVIENERIAAIEATIADIKAMLQSANDNRDFSQIDLSKADTLGDQYNALTTDYKSQRDEFWAAHAEDVAKLDALKTRMADFNTLVEESFPGYAEQKAAEIAAVTEAISALQANIEEAYANAMSSGVYTRPTDDEFSAIDAAIDALAAGLNGSLDDIQQQYLADIQQLKILKTLLETIEAKLSDEKYDDIRQLVTPGLDERKNEVEDLITKANNALNAAQTSGSYDGPTQDEITTAQDNVFGFINGIFNMFISKYDSFSENIDNEWPGYKVIESERIAAIEATIADIKAMLQSANDNRDFSQIDLSKADTLGDQYNALTTDYKSQHDEFWAAHAEDEAKLDALKSKMADFNTLVEESFPGYAEQKAAEIAAVTEAISALQANIEEAYANAMSSGVYTRPADDEFSAIDAAIDALASGVNGSLDDIQQQYQADIQQLMILKTLLETIKTKLSDEKYDDIRQLVTPGLDERKNEVECLITKANNAYNAAQTSGSYDGPTQDEITTAQDNVFGFINGIFNLFITKYDSFSENIDNEWPGYKVIENERIAAIEATIADIKAMLQNANANRDFSQIDLSKADTLGDQYNALTTDYKSQHDELCAAHAEDVAKLDALKTKMADFNALVAESFPGYGKARATEIQEIQQSITNLETQIANAYETAMDNGIYTRPTENEYTSIDNDIADINTELTSTLADIQSNYESAIEALNNLQATYDALIQQINSQYPEYTEKKLAEIQAIDNAIDNILSEINAEYENAIQNTAVFDNTTLAEIDTQLDETEVLINNLQTDYDNYYAEQEILKNTHLIDGIYYLITSDTTAEVVNPEADNNGNAPYSGEITIPATVNILDANRTVTQIADKAFYKSKITSITLQEGVLQIGKNAFYGASDLRYVEIPLSLNAIGDYAFNNCSGLKTFKVKNLDPQKITVSGNAELFAGASTNTSVLIVPEGASDLYKNDYVWKVFGTILEYGKAPTPKFDFDGINNTISISADYGAELYYSFDNNIATSDWARYENPIPVHYNCTIWAYSKLEGLDDSVIADIQISSFHCNQPTIEQDGFMLTISKDNEADIIYYTLDGNDPDQNSQQYTAPIKLIDTGKVKAVAYRTDFNHSEIAQHEITAITCDIPIISYDGHMLNIITSDNSSVVYATADADGIFSDFSEYNENLDAQGIRAVKAKAQKYNFYESPESEILHIDAYFDCDTVITVYAPGHLAQALAWHSDLMDSGYHDITQLHIHGQINADDFEPIRSLKNIEDLYLTDAPVIPDHAFQDMKSLVCIFLPNNTSTTGQSIFKGCSNLCAIDWTSTTSIPVGAINKADIDNPNVLLFSPANGSVNNVDITNVVSSNKTIEKLTLSDAEYAAFYTPYEFSANKAEYTHNYSKETEIGKCQGWETIILPFAPEKFTHKHQDGDRVIAPFGSATDTNLHFWLQRVNDDGLFSSTTSMEAYKPFAIAMPNDIQYEKSYNIVGDVVFSAEKQTIKSVKDVEPVLFGNNKQWELVGTLRPLSNDGNKIALNEATTTIGDQEYAPGAVFTDNERSINAFEAYICADTSASFAPVLMSDLLDNPAQLGNIIVADNALDIHSEAGVLYITTAREATVDLFTASGVYVRPLRLSPGVNSISDLPKGIYILNRQKIVIK